MPRSSQPALSADAAAGPNAALAVLANATLFGVNRHRKQSPGSHAQNQKTHRSLLSPFQWVSSHSTAYVSSPADMSVRTSRTSSFIAIALHEFLAEDLDA